ncbi:transporter substrate-binding domain-containing protein [Candidatus Bipolaricaulota bacterium]|nr:transporter substrate-binding domain-containing protein [Candidatus Bipolaricaulota bacterium]
MDLESKSVLTVGLLAGLLLTLVIGVGVQGQEKDVYRVGVDANFPPWTYVEKGEYQGFDVEIIRAIAEEQDLDIEIIDMPWETIVSALGSGKIDILVSGLSITCERDEQIDYSQPYWSVNQAILVDQDSDLNAITAMSMGNEVGAQRGTTGYMWVQDELVDQGVDVSLNAYEDYVMAVEDLTTGRLDTVLADTTTAKNFVKEGRSVKVIGTVSTGEQYAYAVTEGDPYNLLPKINEGMKQVFETGEWMEIFNKYLAEYGYAPPAKIPMGRELTCE